MRIPGCILLGTTRLSAIALLQVLVQILFQGQVQVSLPQPTAWSTHRQTGDSTLPDTEECRSAIPGLIKTFPGTMAFQRPIATRLLSRIAAMTLAVRQGFHFRQLP